VQPSAIEIQIRFVKVSLRISVNNSLNALQYKNWGCNINIGFDSWWRHCNFSWTWPFRSQLSL